MLIANNHADSIAQLGEVALIEKIGAWLGPVNPPAPAGIGDDCAVIEPPVGAKQIITTDSVSYGQHFDDTVSAEDAGAKLIKRNLSDIAAMAGKPTAALITLGLPKDFSEARIEKVYDGLREIGDQFEPVTHLN